MLTLKHQVLVKIGLKGNRKVRIRMIWLFITTTLALTIVVLLLVFKVWAPIVKINKVMIRILDGDLSLSAPASSKNELGRLGENINELTTNFQETLLFTGTVVGTACESLKKLQKKIKDLDNNMEAEKLTHEVQQIKNNLNKALTIINYFQFFQTHFNGSKVVQSESQYEKKTSIDG